MKRFRLYGQSEANLVKFFGRYSYNKVVLDIPRCGYEDFKLALDDANKLHVIYPHMQMCILDFNQKGKIVHLMG